MICFLTFRVVASLVFCAFCRGPVVSFCKASLSLVCRWKEVPTFRTHHKLFIFFNIPTLRKMHN